VQRVFPIGKAPRFVLVDRVSFRRDYAAESVGVPPTTGWPIECVGSGVHADQAGELRDHFRKSGVDVTVKDNGNPVYTNAAHRRKALKCRGIVDRASYI